jgi:multiple sugar transport system substrate-binding protein
MRSFTNIRIFTLAILALALATVLTAGCGAGDHHLGPVHVRVWSMWTGDEERDFEAVLKEYNRTHPGVVLENLGGVDDPQTVRAIIAGAPPDICTIVDPTYLGTLAANNGVEPLDVRFKIDGLATADYTPGALQQCRYQGRLYALPYLMDCMALLYNKDVFRAAGLDPNRPPRTFEELDADCRQITERGPDRQLTRIGLKPPTELTPAVTFPLYGGAFTDATGTHVTPDAPRNVMALAAYARLMQDQGGYEAVQAFASGFGNNTGSFNPFFHGDVGMTISGEWNPSWAYQYSPKTHYGVAPLPYAADRPDRAGTVWLVDNLFCIPRGAHHAKEAWDFLAWTQSAKAQQMFAYTLHNVPNMRAELHDPKLRMGEPWRPYYARFLDLAGTANAATFPVLPVAALYSNEVGNAFEAVCYGSKQPAQALADVKRRVQPEMDKYLKSNE